MNPFLIAFKNGVYDLKLNIFRSGRPEDYLSKFMPIDYINFNKTDKRVLEVYDFLEKVFPDTSVRQYFLDQASDVFVGGNHQKVVVFWTGEGDNGKSVTQTIFEKMLGELAVKFSTTLITGKKGNIGAASPELSRAGGGVRWAVLEEPDGDEEINIGILKSLSGNDSFFARDLFEKGKSTREISPLFKLVFICNKLPKMKNSDKATWNRIRVIPFESTFVRPNDPNPCPESYEEQLLQKRFPMDLNFGKKIPGLLEPFAWVLLEHRKNIKFRVEPEKVKIATEMYRKQNDIYRQFIDECIVESKSHITLIQLYAQFREWFKMGFPGNMCPVKNEVQEYFTKLWNEPDKGIKWYGYRVRTLEDDIETGEAIILEEKDLVDYNKTVLPPV
jgi:P4 family phage/plasmid primase-like protien